MESAYDRKFEEMKKYIPFLENMIGRLESNSSASANPRQAQLDKIRSLRDLLLDKKKRMKMENLLKCEQVLVNLYNKVEQRNSFSDMKPAEDVDSPNTKEKKDLEVVRNKLKTVTKLQEGADTLPEIARANDVEQYCSPGSKEPALFQRRPNMPESQAPKSNVFDKKSKSPQPRRNYTRVLVSPDQSPRRWSPEKSNKPLFSRRSPARSKSPIKKEKKKRSKRKTKGLNITLKVPEDSLNSLNTEDILSRILTCSDGDVDIGTLRELRSQILGELKQTGANNDISDLILKSYNKKSKKNKSKSKHFKTRQDVEEGELSDSESEAIGSIYGSLVMTDKDSKSSAVKPEENKSKQPRKIQICLVINSEKEDKAADLSANKTIDITEFEVQSESDAYNTSKEVISVDSDTSSSPQKKDREATTTLISVEYSPAKKNLTLSSPVKKQPSDIKNIISPAKTHSNNIITNENDNRIYKESKVELITQIIDMKTLQDCKDSTESTCREDNDNNLVCSSPKKDEIHSPIKADTQKSHVDNSEPSEIGAEQDKSLEKTEENKEQPSKFIANFYKPLEEHQEPEPEKLSIHHTSDKDIAIENSTKLSLSNIENPNIRNDTITVESVKDSTEIPLLNEPTLPPKAKKDVLSEIDILRALKNEILSDTISVPISETVTPALHQPKLTKVANAQEVAPKKRISIEKYKANSKTPKPLFLKHRYKLSQEEHKKQSLKLTEKECERFNFPKRVSLDDDNDSSDDDFLLNSDHESLGLDDIYGDLAPKSPDNDMSTETSAPPVIIPVDPVKTNIVSSKSDVDMRKISILSPTTQSVSSPVIPPSPSYNNNIDNRQSTETNTEGTQKGTERPRFNTKDPRMRRDLNLAAKDSAMPHSSSNPDRTPRAAGFPNMTPNMTPSYMPSMTPIMTPNARTFEMTPSHQSFELENFSTRKHVYAPSFSAGENREREVSVSRDSWDVKNDPKGHRSRWERESHKLDPPVTPRYEDSYSYNSSRNDHYYRDKREGYSRADVPTTPIPSFGWSDCPSTPASSFGRQDPSMTPSHSFGRSEYPGTPSHPFGRSECPSTPVHSFGRNDAPQTPSHPFGRSEATSFSRQDSSNTSKYNKDPRLYTRQREYETSSYSEKERNFENERGYNRGGSYRSQNKPYSGKDAFKYDRERSQSYYSTDHNVRQYDRDRREESECSTLSKESDNDRLYTRNRDGRYDGRHSRNNDVDSRRYQRERSVGRISEYNPSPRERNERARSISRAPSVGRSCGNERQKDNTLSFKSDTGRSLTINTSVKSTFQDFLDKPIQVFDYSFDARRQRAASVGRSLVREGSVGRNLTSIKTNKTFTDHSKKDDRYKRACSMGRELTIKNKSERSFKDLKADFESFKSKLKLDSRRDDKFKRASSTGREVVREKSEHSFKNLKADVESVKSKLKINTQKQDSLRSRKDIFHDQSRQSNQTSKQQYSPRKNYRDPRMRKESIIDTQSRYKIDRRGSNSRDKHNTGIVYSSDNIAKGTIMGSGFGVKNYKIPKIKRAPEESKEDDEEKNVTIEKDSKEKKGVLDVQIDKKQDKNKEVKKSIEETVTEVKTNDSQAEFNKLAHVVDDSERRMTRSKSKPVSPRITEDELIIRTRRSKKAVIHDSDSDSEKQTDSNSIKTKSAENISLKSPIKKKISPKDLQKEIDNKTNEEILDSGFAIDDMEMFTENIGGDSVIDNINALIADLDNDIDTSKIAGGDFNTDIEKMMESIDSPESDSLGDISEVIEKDLNKNNESIKQDPLPDNLLGQSEVSTDVPTHQKPDNLVQTKNDSHNSYSESELVNILKDSAKEETIAKKECSDIIKAQTFEDTDLTMNNTVNEAIVSTTEIDQDLKNIEDSNQQTPNDDDQSVPDSTINKNGVTEKSEEVVADSTNDIHCELSSDVTSTHDIGKTSKKETEVNSSAHIDTSSIGSLLSILQDKSKIKELLAMLGDKSSENDKMKKKLERLSEIVSDEDDVNDKNEDQSKMTDLRKQSCDTSTEEVPKKSNEPVSIDVVKVDEEKQIDPSSEEKIDNTNDIKYKDKLGEESAIEGHKKHNISKPIDKLLAKEIDEKIPVGLTDDSAKEKNVSLDDEEKKIENVSPECNIENNDDDNEVDPDDKNEIEDDEEQDEVDEEPVSKVSRKMTRKITIKKNAQLKKPAAIKPKSQMVSARAQIKKRGHRSELKKLQDDIKEMFMSDDILNATGIRMCRLAKMTHGKEENKKEDSQMSEPVVVLKKVKDIGISDDTQDKTRKKVGLKKGKMANGPQKSAKNDKVVDAKVKSLEQDDKRKKSKSLLNKPGPKSKTKPKRSDVDPYEFDTDSITDTNTTKESDESSSDSESDSLASSLSIGSSEVLAETKKKVKRKRFGWKSGVIKPKNKKKKEPKQVDNPAPGPSIVPLRTIPDFNCFTDKTYCFDKGVSSYQCRLCEFTGKDIVTHYKKQHPHTEIPLSRMNPQTAEIAIKQCEEINFQAISKIPSNKYVCRFCHKEFGRNKSALEFFFWHVVSSHTGEYKHLCSECVNVTRCPFNLDIPPPPKDIKGQLIGYICGKCNFTQISLENLKTHVIVRHNDEQTEVYTINLAKLSKKAMKVMLSDTEESPRVLRNRSLRSNQSTTETSDNRSEAESSERISEADTLPLAAESLAPKKKPVLEVPKVEPDALKSKLTFENDEPSDETSVKMEQEEHETDNRDEQSHFDDTFDTDPADENPLSERVPEEPELIPEVTRNSDVIMDYAHFKLNHLNSGAKEYVCCINGSDNHYKTTLLISMKKHIQSKHSEKWDGYCCLCKVIVTLQGVQSDFRDCLTHFLDKHMDDFPVLEKPMQIANIEPPLPIPERIATPPVRTASPGYLAVRPLAELISKELVKEIALPSEAPFPKIENVVSLGESETLPPQCSPVYPSTAELEPQPQRPFLYEEFQAEVMSKKHTVVLDAMMPKNKLVRVFKCAGRFCSFTSDSADAALVHASTHQRIGGDCALNCAYCNFDACENAIDLVMHVFKVHSQCQYSCSLCFYRAAASQLVGVHYKRVHNTTTPVNVLRTTGTAVPPVSTDANNAMLSREVAVLHFICNHDDGNCNFKTFTPGKFLEHLTQKHSNVSSHPCQLCPNTSPSPQELIVHMKVHEMNLYQCTWCVHGADNEASLLSHVASCHPSQQPQAYIRVITNKDGSAQRRVLPLAFFNKTTVPQEDVSPNDINENPVREAERSIELEKLIGLTSHMIENAPSSSNQTPNEPENTDVIEPNMVEAPLQEAQVKKEPEETEKRLSKPSVICLDSDDDETTDPLAEPLVNSSCEPDIGIDDTNNANTATEDVMLKKVETPRRSVTDDVTITKISDDVRKSVSDDDSRHAIIELSDEESTKKPDQSSANKVRVEALLKCPKCKMVCKSSHGLKKHMNKCCGDIIELPCPHAPCATIMYSFGQMVDHFNSVHVEKDQFLCGVCNTPFTTIGGTKLHVRSVHRGTPYVVSTKKTDGVGHVTTVGVLPAKHAQAPLRTERKYGVGDVDRLPITPILDSPVQCELCGFSTKVRLNMVRHLQLHAGRMPAPRSQPVNPVPHLETNEMHFDRMVNLASSSAGERPAAAAARYPCHVPERQRFACGAPACSYISLDEATLRRHWEALHAGAAAFRCAHCPPDQRLDASKPLSAARIVAHLKMHDASLYACSACTFYHFKARAVERHATETHRGGARVLVVREEGAAPAPAPPPPAGPAAPTMDLKPWRCGLCEFFSMLRPAVSEHCAAAHHSKMQYKCAYCPFRTSVSENVAKHQTNAHPARAEEIVHYYYREGSIPDEVDGLPRWKKQRLILGLPELEIKAEPEPEPAPPAPSPAPVAAPLAVDLNLVKKEVDAVAQMSVEDLCKKFGKFCEPNGIKYKCCLCTAVTTQTGEEMRAHLFEELNYRRLGCGLCSYKAFHKAGLNEHNASEHPRQSVPPTELPVDRDIEKWVTSALDHQTTAIEKNKLNFAAQAIQMERPPAVVAPRIVESSKQSTNASDAELEHAFGNFGEAKGQHFSCPKCDFLFKDEMSMRNHLESELTKIRWCCTECANKFTTYHEAQFHCRSGHANGQARPKEAIRDPNIRAMWVSKVINTQKQTLQSDPEPDSQEKTLEADNSLLVARYDEPAPIEPVQIIPPNKRPAPSADSDDDARLVIDEPPKKKPMDRKCQYCDYSSTTKRCLREHILAKHYNLRPYKCSLCPSTGSRPTVMNHMEKRHPGAVHHVISLQIPNYAPPYMDTKKKPETDDGIKKVCLYCEKSVPESEMDSHLHENEKPEFAKRADVVVKCLKCLELRLSVTGMQEHFASCHPSDKIAYAFFKLQVDLREIHCCEHCYRKFKNFAHLREHHTAMHLPLPLAYTSIPYNRNLRTECDSDTGKRKLEDSAGPPAKRTARKSTTKLPNSAVAKKSTTKLPYTGPESSEYSFYGNKPLPIQHYEDVTFLMPMYNSNVEVDVKKLSGILKIDPKVVVSDCKR